MSCSTAFEEKHTQPVLFKSIYNTNRKNKEKRSDCRQCASADLA